MISLPKGFAVVSLEGVTVRELRQGLPVLDAHGVRVGSASDVIGNVRSPYAVVRLDAAAKVSVGDELYLVIPEGRGERRRRGRRSRR